jgi:hypothetical protein
MLFLIYSVGEFGVFEVVSRKITDVILDQLTYNYVTFLSGCTVYVNVEPGCLARTDTEQQRIFLRMNVDLSAIFQLKLLEFKIWNKNMCLFIIIYHDIFI